MKKQALINIINECIEEILNESNCSCEKDCNCQPSSKKSVREDFELQNRMIINKAKKLYPHADFSTIQDYVRNHPNGATIGQLENDSKKYKWNGDTSNAIYYVMKNIKK